MNTRIQNQPIILKLLYSLIPIILFSIYLFGWRVLLVLIVSNLAAYITEYLFIRNKPNGKVTLSVFATGTLIGLSLPPSIPFLIAALGSFIAIFFGKMVFGGYGTNMFNPALVGRTFIYVSFPKQMTISWAKPFIDFPGGFVQYAPHADMTTGATILSHFRNTGELLYPFRDVFLGLKSGSMGETSALLLIICAIYLIFSKTASWKPMVGTALSMLLFNFLFYPHINPLYFLFSGGAMFGIVYFVTEPVTLPKGKIAVWIYGLMIGFLAVFIRAKSLFYEGFMFAVLIANSFMPIIEYALNSATQKKADKKVQNG
ncbi:MAG TPA: RnfABCDGE type electron transport complex subunit D [Candidatus Cloacimonadota bacterium]|nr:RnfABCDGE type electron transport complex subunit D [Candidatus Cloacimonadota bacterium]